jgi:flagellar hook-basal body complex protein FliE
MRSNFPQYDLTSRIAKSKIDASFNNMPSARLKSIEAPETGNFKQVFTGMLDELNTEMNAPDNMLKDLMSGNKNVDIHDVMTAMSKSEVTINVATQMIGKVINAYDRISQISV